MLADMGNGGVTWIFADYVDFNRPCRGIWGYQLPVFQIAERNWYFGGVAACFDWDRCDRCTSSRHGDRGHRTHNRDRGRFSQALLEGMLGLLLFAGALHVKLSDLQKQWSLILLMATLGVALSTLVFGVGAHLMFGLPLLVALVFGSLISPTDPVAVLGVLRASNLKKTLETKNRRRKPI